MAGRESLTVEGLVTFQRDLKKFEPAVAKALRARLKKAVDDVAQDARRRAPRRSGRLVKGIKASVTNKGAALVSKSPHARISEFGGRHPVYGNRDVWVAHPARPHIYPAVRAGRATVNREALAALDTAIKESGFQ